MGGPGPWSEAEHQKLRTLYSDRTLSLNEIAAKFGRSSTSIEHCARKLGCSDSTKMQISTSAIFKI
jgi:hypothetical protein